MNFGVRQRPLVLILNITHYCNLNCQYCYYKDDMEGQREVMSEAAIDRIVDMLEESSYQSVWFCFHGGEPLLNRELIEYTVARAEERLEDRELAYSIQTNGTIIDDQTLRLLRRMNWGGSYCSLGISLDGNEELHDQYRRFRSGKGSHSLILENLAKLAADSIDYGCISVITGKSLEQPVEELYEFYKSLPSLKGLQLLFQSDKSLEIDRLTGFMTELFHRWFYDSGPGFTISLFVFIILSFLKLGLRDCQQMANCFRMGNFLSITPDGTAFPCDSMHTCSLGNINELSLDELTDRSLIRKRYIRDEERRVEDCRFCEWYDYCYGGCPTHSTANSPPNYYCKTFKALFRMIKGALTELEILTPEGEVRLENIGRIENTSLREELKEKIDISGR